MCMLRCVSKSNADNATLPFQGDCNRDTNDGDKTHIFAEFWSIVVELLTSGIYFKVIKVESTGSR